MYLSIYIYIYIYTSLFTRTPAPPSLFCFGRSDPTRASI